MSDLNLVTHYKASFSLRKPKDNDNVDILWELVYLIRKWLAIKADRMNDKKTASWLLDRKNNYLWTKFKMKGGPLNATIAFCIFNGEVNRW